MDKEDILKKLDGKVKFYCFSKDDASKKAGDLLIKIISSIDENEKFLLGTSTGRTPEKLYEYLRENFSAKTKNITLFQQDSYVGNNISGKIGLDYKGEIEESLVKPCFPESNFFIPDGTNSNLEESVEKHKERLNDLIEKSAMYLQILGIGHNGHIGFNEPGTPFETGTHVVSLTEDSRIENGKKYFDGDMSKVPENAITTGLAELGKANTAILLAFGDSKADAIYKTFFTEPTPDVPASVLVKKHVPTYVFCDEESAAEIKEKIGDVFENEVTLFD